MERLLNEDLTLLSCNSKHEKKVNDNLLSPVAPPELPKARPALSVIIILKKENERVMDMLEQGGDPDTFFCIIFKLFLRFQKGFLCD